MKFFRSSSGIRSNLVVGVGGFKFPSAESLGATIVVTLDCTVRLSSACALCCPASALHSAQCACMQRVSINAMP